MIKLFTDKEVTLNFALNVEGSSTLPEARMILTLDSGLNISLPAKIEENTAKITIPPLKKHLKNSDFSSAKAYLEVIADGNYFVPWKDICELQESVHISINEDVEVSQKKENFNIIASIDSISESEEKKNISPILFNETNTKKALVDKWNEYKKVKVSKDLNINTVHASGYFEGLDAIIKTLKPFMETLTVDSVHTKIQTLMKSAVELKEKADNEDNQYNKEFYEGYYSAIVDTFISV